MKARQMNPCRAFAVMGVTSLLPLTSADSPLYSIGSTFDTLPPALTPLLIFRPRATVWLWLVVSLPALTFVLIFILLHLNVDVERRHTLCSEADSRVSVHAKTRGGLPHEA